MPLDILEEAPNTCVESRKLFTVLLLSICVGRGRGEKYGQE